MEDYKVKEEDLIGELEGFPIEVVQKMVDYQIEQGNVADIKVFQNDGFTPSYDGGFTWGETTDGPDFWNDVVICKNFDIFFEKYPKEVKLDAEPPKENIYTEISNEPHILCSYEGYKSLKIGRSLSSKIDEIPERTMKLAELALKFNKTKEEEEEYKKLSKEMEVDRKNIEFTSLTHEITDLYFELKNIHDDELRHERYEEIGRKQCKLEIIKEEFKNK